MTMHVLSRKCALEMTRVVQSKRIKKKINYENNKHKKASVFILISKYTSRQEYHQQQRGTFHNDQRVNSTK